MKKNAICYIMISVVILISGYFLITEMLWKKDIQTMNISDDILSISLLKDNTPIIFSGRAIREIPEKSSEKSKVYEMIINSVLEDTPSIKYGDVINIEVVNSRKVEIGAKTTYDFIGVYNSGNNSYDTTLFSKLHIFSAVIEKSLGKKEIQGEKVQQYKVKDCINLSKTKSELIPDGAIVNIIYDAQEIKIGKGYSFYAISIPQIEGYVVVNAGTPFHVDVPY